MSIDIKNNSVHLCNSCSYDYPDCPSEEYIFGDGIGNDNICCCGSYDPLWTKEMYEIHIHEKRMSDYITKEQAIEVIGYAYLNNLTRDERVHEIEALPSADVVENKRGHWEKKKGYRKCVLCGATMIDSGFDDFCPHCGADMRGKK